MVQAFMEVGREENYFQKCGRPGEGGGGVNKFGHLRTRGGGSKNGKNLRTSFIINTLICACTSSRCLGKRGGYSKRKGTVMEGR